MYKQKKIFSLMAGFLCISAVAQPSRTLSPVITSPGVIDQKTTTPNVGVSADPGVKSAQSNVSDLKILVKSFRIDGVSVFSADELLIKAGARPNVEYGFSQLESIAARVTQLYRERGFLVARAILPVQFITDGVVNIQVFEGHFSASNSVNVKASASGKEDVGAVREVLKTALCGENFCAQEVVTKDKVEHAIELISEVTGVKVLQSNLQPGREVGSTSLTVQTAPRAPYRVEVGIDNFGSEKTGVTQVQGRLLLNDLMNTGDQLGVSYLTTDGANLKYYGLDYSLPIGYSGWRLGGAAGRSHYIAPGVVSGGADVRTVYASYPVMRTERRVVDYVAAYDSIDLSSDSAQSDNRKLGTFRTGFSGAFLDDASDLGRANNEWSAMVSGMNLRLEDGRVDSNGVAGERSKFNWRYGRIQNIGSQGWFAGANAFGQFASNNLDPYSKLSLGGVNAVRAYALGEAAGDRAAVVQLSVGDGWLTSIDERTYNVSTSVFYDRGWSQRQKSPVAVAGNSAVLSGYGVELQVNRKDHMALRVFYARASEGESAVDAKRSRVGVSVGIAF